MSAQTVSIYGLVGYPLGHSLSPAMHNAAFQSLSVNAVYKLFPLKSEALDDFFQSLKSNDSPIFGLNVTIPYKEKVLEYCDSLQPYAQQLKAVNTLVIDEKRRIKGYNTDGPGFLTHLTELGFDPHQKRIAVLGAGGAARAIISALCLIPQKPLSIKIFDIDSLKAQQLIRDLGQSFNLDIVSNSQSLDDLNIELADLVINATPVGLKKDDPIFIDEEWLRADMWVYDLIYNPSETNLLKMAKKKGAKTSNGLGMLFYQGVLAFQHWAELELSSALKNQMKQALHKGLKGTAND